MVGISEHLAADALGAFDVVELVGGREVHGPVDGHIDAGPHLPFQSESQGDVHGEGLSGIAVGESESELYEGRDALVALIAGVVAVGQEVELVGGTEVGDAA